MLEVEVIKIWAYRYKRYVYFRINNILDVACPINNDLYKHLKRIGVPTAQKLAHVERNFKR